MWPVLIGLGVIGLALLAMADDPDEVPADPDGAGFDGIGGSGKPLRGAACITPETLEEYPSLRPHVVRVDNPEPGVVRPGGVGRWEPVCYRLTEGGLDALLDLADEVGVTPRAWALSLTDASFGRPGGTTANLEGWSNTTGYSTESVDTAKALLVAAGLAPSASVVEADRRMRRRGMWLGVLAGLASYVSTQTSGGSSSVQQALGSVASIVEVYANAWQGAVTPATLAEATSWALDNPPWVALSASAANRSREDA